MTRSSVRALGLLLIPILINAARVPLCRIPQSIPSPARSLRPSPDSGMPAAEIPRRAAPAKDLTRVDPAGLPRFIDDGDPTPLKRAVDRSIAELARRGVHSLPFGGRHVRRLDLMATLVEFRSLLELPLTREELDSVIRARFDVYRSPGQSGLGDVLYTAYNDPVFDGALTPDAVYRFPLYRPPELAHIANTRYDRAAIQRGVLSRRGLELVWLKTPVEAYLFELEGAGLVRLREGGLYRVRYAASNGRSYAGLGAEVERKGLLESEAQARASGRLMYLKAPQLALAELARNPRVIFFRGERLTGVLPELDLLPGRSVAVDTAYFPRGGLGFMRVDRPVLASGSGIARFAVNQDTGDAIRGPGRIDIYWGHDAAAQVAAGQFREAGALYYLLRKGTALVAAPPPARPVPAIIARAEPPRPAKRSIRVKPARSVKPVKPVKPARAILLADARVRAGKRAHHARSRAPSGPLRPGSGSRRRRRGS